MVEQWMDDALCRRFGNLPWIAEPEHRSGAAAASLAAVCFACGVRSECESFVHREGVVSGFWAGADRTPEADVTWSGGAA